MSEEMEKKAKIMADRLRCGIVALQMRIHHLQAGMTALDKVCKEPLRSLIDEYLNRTSDMAMDVGLIVAEAANMLEEMSGENKEKDNA